MLLKWIKWDREPCLSTFIFTWMGCNRLSSQRDEAGRVTVWMYLCVGDDHWWPSAKNWSCSSDGWSAEIPGRHSSFQLLPGPNVRLDHSSSHSISLARFLSSLPLIAVSLWYGYLSPHAHSNRNDCPDPRCEGTLKPKSVWSLTSTGEEKGTELAISCFPVCGSRWCHSLITQQTVTSPGTKDQPIADGQFATWFEPWNAWLCTDLSLRCCQYFF